MSANQPLPNQTPPELTPPASQSALPAVSPVASSTPPPASYPAAPSGVRPMGVTLMALLSLLQGALGACGACFVLGLSGGMALVPTGVTQVIGGLGIVLGLLLGAGPFLHLIFAYGAWNLRKWAWLLGLIATGVSVAGVIISIIGSGGATIWTAVTNALIPIVIFVYLLMPNVRNAFDR